MQKKGEENFALALNYTHISFLSLFEQVTRNRTAYSSAQVAQFSNLSDMLLPLSTFLPLSSLGSAKLCTKVTMRTGLRSQQLYSCSRSAPFDQMWHMPFCRAAGSDRNGEQGRDIFSNPNIDRCVPPSDFPLRCLLPNSDVHYHQALRPSASCTQV